MVSIIVSDPYPVKTEEMYMRRHWNTLIPLIFVSLATTCKPEPPRVALKGPDTAGAGSEASYEVELTPTVDDASFTWKVSWIRDHAGKASCSPTVEGGDTALAKVKFPADCESERFRISVMIESAGNKTVDRKTVQVVRVEEPMWPDPLPPGWEVLNDYEKPGKPRANLWGGFFGTWGFHGGRCGIKYGDDAPGVLRLSYAMHMDDSSCGMFEYLKGERGKSKPVDISPFEKIAFMLKSGDERVHRISFEIVEFDRYAASLQGYVGDSRLLLAGPEWKRYEVRLDEVLHTYFERKNGKQVGIKIEHKNQEQASGVVLLDNIAFIGKGGRTGDR